MNEIILLIEDDMALAMGTKYSLQSEGMEVISACDFASTKNIFVENKGKFDLVLLDVMLPDADGYEICAWIRKNAPMLPVIFLTALDDEGNVVHGLEVGGDDYVTKPFRTKELIARIRANIRKIKRREDNSYSGNLYVGNKERDGSLTDDNLVLDEKNFSLLRKGKKIPLTPSEFKLVRELMKNKGQILTRDQLIDSLWSVDEAFVDDNTLSVYIRRLREKIDEDGKESYIRTIRGVGYEWGRKSV